VLPLNAGPVPDGYQQGQVPTLTAYKAHPCGGEVLASRFHSRRTIGAVVVRVFVTDAV
jgi:hypothetical protein